MKAIRLKTEYLTNPIGIDRSVPRLFWNCMDGIKQTAYQILATNSGNTAWDSGKVSSGAMARVPYAGVPLESRQHIIWKVRLWNEKDEVGQWSDDASFEMGLLSRDDWNAEWITGDYKVNKKRRYPVDCFKKEFSIQKEIKQARLYITACGLYEANLGGYRVGDFILAPGHTDYRKRVQYQSYDVTGLLKSGQNELTIELADGWYRGSTGAWGLKNEYGTETKLLAQLEIGHVDGTTTIIASDDSWDWSNDGPIRFADNQDGEIVEAWRLPSYSGKAKITKHSVFPVASNNVPVVEKERFAPQMSVAPNGNVLLNFGQNIAGYLEFAIMAKKGQRVFLRFGEMLDKDGNLTQKNIQCTNKKITTPLQQIEYFCKDGENRYKTKFAVFGFQYVEVLTEAKIDADKVTAIAVYSDMEQTGFFESSSELLNKFVEATIWSAKGNSLDVPTDCPTRERHGWTGDAQIFFDTAAYLFDYAGFSKKYLTDMYDWQKKNGKLPQIAPYGGVDLYMTFMDGSVGWADAGILIPYRFWKRYGDADILRQFYPGMKKYAEFMIGRCGKWGGPFARRLRVRYSEKKYVVNCGQSYGEWAEPTDVHRMRWTDFAEPHPEVSTAYTSYVLGVMAKIAEELGEKQDSEHFKLISVNCKEAYQALCETKEFTLDTNRQARLVRPLSFHLLNGKQRKFAQKRLLEAIDGYGWRLGTGFLSTPLILDVLSEMNIEYAYRLLENEEMPGWLFMPKNGATTIWESWEGTQAQGGIASLNHYSKGAVCEWLFKTMCGINISGENRFTISPNPGGKFTYAKATYKSIYGEVSCAWKVSKATVEYEVAVPAGCSAQITLPKGLSEELPAGKYHFHEEI